jgi:hypothetical protein
MCVASVPAVSLDQHIQDRLLPSPFGAVYASAFGFVTAARSLIVRPIDTA